MPTHTTLHSLFGSVADAIRAKKGTTGAIVADNFPSEIASIPTGIVRVPSDITKSDNVVTVPAGLYSSQMQATVGSVLGSQTITPTTYNQTISSDRYLTGTQTILGDGNLAASNIKNGISIFGVNGSYVGNWNCYYGTADIINQATCELEAPIGLTDFNDIYFLHVWEWYPTSNYIDSGIKTFTITPDSMNAHILRNYAYDEATDDNIAYAYDWKRVDRSDDPYYVSLSDDCTKIVITCNQPSSGRKVFKTSATYAYFVAT